MEKGLSRITALLLTAMLCVSFLPSTSADGSTEPEHYAFGMEYNYSNLNDDFGAMTGLPLDDILMDIMDSADDAGINLQVLEVTTGVSTIIVDQYTDGTESWMIDGSATELTRHVTDLTIRNGALVDIAIITDWDDAWAGWDLTFTYDSEGVMNLDATYVEFRDATGAIYGFDTELTGAISSAFSFGVYGSINGESQGDVLPLNIEASLGVDYAITSATSEIRLEAPSNLNNDLADLEAGDWYEWGFEDYFYDDYDDNEYYYWDGEYAYCEWEGDGTYDAWDCSYNMDYGYDNWWYYCEEIGYESWYCTDDFGQNEDWEYSAPTTYFEDGGSPSDDDNEYYDWDGEYAYCEWEGDGTYDAWDCSYNMDYGYDNWWYYCEEIGYESWYCTDDFGQNEDWEYSAPTTYFEDGGSPYDEENEEGESKGDVIESMDGTFATTSGFNFELTGLPAEEFGFPEGDWDFSASDSATDSGTFDFESDEIDISGCGLEMELMGGTQLITMDDGTQTEVLQAYMSPIPMPMVCQVASLIANAMAGSEDAVSMFLESPPIEEWIWANELSSNDGGDGDIRIEIEESSEDEIVFYLDHCCSLDYEETYEVSAVLEADDGTTVAAHSFVVTEQSWFNEEIVMDAQGWGDYCLNVEVSEVGSSGDYPVAEGENCFTIEQEPEPSQLLMDIGESFADSTLESAMEIFADNMEHRLSDYEADIAYNEGDAYVLWDTTANKVVGFQILVSNEDTSNWWTLIGPESNTYGAAPTPLSATYFSGVQATDAEAAVEDSDSLEELVDLTMHDTSAIEDAVEAGGDAPGTGGDGGGVSSGDVEVTEENLEEGLLPFLSPAATIAIVALAGLVSTLRPRRD